MSRLMALLLAVALSIGVARGGDDLALAGGEYSGLGSYSYLGVILPLGSEHLGEGLVMRHWLERLTYEYDSGSTRIHAKRYAYAPALGYQGKLGGGSFGLYGGLRIASTDLSPDDPSNDENGHTNRVFFDVNAFTPLGSRAENQLVASFETRYSDYYFRDRLLFRTSDRYTFGPEVVLKGGQDYSGWQAGLALGGIRFATFDLVIRSGISAQQGESSTAYGSVELSTNF